jgi:hypothetical protein
MPTKVVSVDGRSILFQVWSSISSCFEFKHYCFQGFVSKAGCLHQMSPSAADLTDVLYDVQNIFISRDLSRGKSRGVRLKLPRIEEYPAFLPVITRPSKPVRNRSSLKNVGCTNYAVSFPHSAPPCPFTARATSHFPATPRSRSFLLSISETPCTGMNPALFIIQHIVFIP